MKNNDIIHTDNINDQLKNIIKKYDQEKKLIITDHNCRKYCLPVIQEIIDDTFEIFEIKPGEDNKSLDTVKQLWSFLSEKKYTRESLIINLGGGMVSDLGGFAASTFKRGIPYINIPTTILAQVDASVGGKTGINFMSLKNEIGVFSEADHVLISEVFIKSLKKREFLSGFAEMLKHALIHNDEHYSELIEFITEYESNENLKKLNSLTKQSVKIKEHYIKNDLYDKGKRKILNFGHTFGHAFESHFNLNKNLEIKHGEAVAQGIICEIYLSHKKLNFESDKMNRISNDIKNIYKIIKPKSDEFDLIHNLMTHDKKNLNDVINCVLINNNNIPLFDQEITKDDITDALNYLNSV